MGEPVRHMRGRETEGLSEDLKLPIPALMLSSWSQTAHTHLRFQACETNMDTPWFGRLLGAFFNNHPFTQDATMLVQKEFRDHPSVSHLPKVWKVYDEIYR